MTLDATFSDINKAMDLLLIRINELMGIIDIHKNEINAIKIQNKKSLTEAVDTFTAVNKAQDDIINKLSDQIVVLETKLTALAIVDNEHMKLHFRDIS